MSFKLDNQSIEYSVNVDGRERKLITNVDYTLSSGVDNQKMTTFDSTDIDLYQGFKPSKISVTFDLIYIPESLKAVEYLKGLYYALDDDGTPKIYSIQEPLINSWGVNYVEVSEQIRIQKVKNKSMYKGSLQFKEYRSKQEKLEEREELSKEAVIQSNSQEKIDSMSSDDWIDYASEIAKSVYYQ